MCHAVPCRQCQKTTWSGCGAHVAQVKAGIPDDQWCGGHSAPEQSGQQAAGEPGWWRRVTGRG